MEDIWQVIQQVAFPIVVSVYLLVRFEKKLEELKESVNKLADKIEALEILDQLRKGGRNVN